MDAPSQTESERALSERFRPARDRCGLFTVTRVGGSQSPTD